MSKRMTLYFHDEKIYNGLIAMVGRGNISSFVENLIRPIILRNNTDEEIEQGYKLMAQDEEREKEAQDWGNGVISDVGNEPW
jgi:hypothetical protein